MKARVVGADYNLIDGQKIAFVDKLTGMAAIEKQFPQSARQAKVELLKMRATMEDEARIHDRGRTVGMNKSGGAQLQAIIPEEVIVILREFAPEILSNSKEYRKWLARHPEYQVGRTIRR
jgi:hypothetical protein